jgi:AraC-like DNA-binding protein
VSYTSHRSCGELILETTRTVSLMTRNRAHVALRDVLLAQITKAIPIPTTLTVPDDPRAKRLAEATLVDPISKRKPECQCRDLGMSVRTLQRIFRRDLGVDYDTWRRSGALAQSR